MSEQLKPGAFRVWDETEKQYGTNWKTNVFILDANGVLYFGDNRGDNLYALLKANPDRYQVERWTGWSDSHSNTPIYANDIVLIQLKDKFNNILGLECFVVENFAATFALVFRDEYGALGCNGRHGFFENNAGLITNHALLPMTVIGTIHDSYDALKAKAQGAGK